MDRRRFLHASLSAATCAGLLSASRLSIALDTGTKSKADEKSARKINVGMHVWVYAKHQPDYDVYGILSDIWADVKYAGLDGIELMEQPLRRQDKTREIAELIEAHRLPLIGTSYGANFWDKAESNRIYDDLANILTNMQVLSARTIGVSVGKPQNRDKTEQEFDAQADLIQRTQALALEHGVVLNLHNHTYEVEKQLFDLKNTLKRIPDIPLGPDINWLVRAGVEPNAFLKQYQDNIVFLHLRDQHASGAWAESIGEGDTDFTKLGHTLDAINFKGDAIIELAHEDGFTPTRPIKESLKMSRAHIRNTLGF